MRAQLKSQHGGADVDFDAGGKRTGGARLLAVVTLIGGQSGRNFRLPGDSHYRAVWRAQQRLRATESAIQVNGLSFVPDERIPLTELSRISLPIYGVDHFRSIFTCRQLLVLATLALVVARRETDDAFNAAVDRLLALSLDKTVVTSTTPTPVGNLMQNAQ